MIENFNDNFRELCLNLKIDERKFILGLSGGIGSGKSTVLNLLLQFRRAIKGSFTFDGLDVFKYGTVKSFKSHLGVVFQKTMLINGTVRENITYGLTNITEMEIY